ncbi:MAG TPA: FMN-binding protein [Treponema sp.]|nr:FMN-binding protein [Treponema sp.]
MKSMIKLSSILAAFTVTACLCLALVYQLTAPYIAANEARALTKGLHQLFPEAERFDTLEDFPVSKISSISFDGAYLAVAGDQVLGIVVRVTGPTYKSSTILVAADTERKLKPLVFIENADTPEIGTKTAESPFVDQFTGKSLDDPFSLGDDLDTISGATISAKGVARLVQLAGYQAGEYLATNHGAAEGSAAAPIIKEAAPMPLEIALEDIWPGHSFEDVSSEVSNTIERSVVFDSAWIVRNGTTVSGIAIQARGQTYKASTVLVGIGPDRRIAGVRINETTDTQNYGYVMVEPEFYETFTGKSVDDAFLVAPTTLDGDIDAISSATVSTLGVANIIKVAALEGSRYLAEAQGGKAGKVLSAPIVLNEIPEQE